MANPLSLKNIRKELIERCDAFIKIFTESQKLLTLGGIVIQAHRKKFVSQGSTITIDLKDSTTAESYLLVLIHAGLIQEWLIFLDSVFEEGVRYFLKYKLVDRLPSISFNVKKVKPIRLVEMRESICFALKDSFSFSTNYPYKINKLNKFFNYNPDKQPEIKELQSEMKKHVTVRNVWQHNRGFVRPRELDAIKPKDYFDILGVDGKPRQYRNGDKIELTKNEIDSLNTLIKNYSKKFEVLK